LPHWSWQLAAGSQEIEHPSAQRTLQVDPAAQPALPPSPSTNVQLAPSSQKTVAFSPVMSPQ
jgi:hypothetical protein